MLAEPASHQSASQQTTNTSLAETDPELAAVLKNELGRSATPSR